MNTVQSKINLPLVNIKCRCSKLFSSLAILISISVINYSRQSLDRILGQMLFLLFRFAYFRIMNIIVDAQYNTNSIPVHQKRHRAILSQ